MAKKQTKASKTDAAIPTTPEPKPQPKALSRGNGVSKEYLVVLNGQERFLTQSAIKVILSRIKAKSDPERPTTLEIPKGSEFVVPEGYKGGCNGC